MGKVRGKIKNNSKFAPRLKEITKELNNIKGESQFFRQIFLGSEKELEAVEGYKEYLASFFNCSITVYVAESGDYEDPLKRAIRAQPGKPALYIQF